MTVEYLADRDDKAGYRFPAFEYRDRFQKSNPARGARTPSQDLARVREVFQPTVTDLAALFGVSRQAIYNWQAGDRIAPQNEQRLAELALAADLLTAEGLSERPSFMRRKLVGGKAFFDLVREGRSPTEVADKLIALVKKEAAQRLVIERRLAARARKPLDVGDIGSPHLVEGV